jgi:hypothetical protein
MYGSLKYGSGDIKLRSYTPCSQTSAWSSKRKLIYNLYRPALHGIVLGIPIVMKYFVFYLLFIPSCGYVYPSCVNTGHELFACISLMRFFEFNKNDLYRNELSGKKTWQVLFWYLCIRWSLSDRRAAFERRSRWRGAAAGAQEEIKRASNGEGREWRARTSNRSR